MATQQPANAGPPAATAAPQVAQNGPPPVVPDAAQNQQQPGQTADPVSQATNAGQNSPTSNSFTTSLGTSTSTGPTQTHFTIPITAAAGEIIITQPASALGGSTPLFKLAPTGNPANASANWVVFGWNMTNVYEGVLPTSLTLRAGCANGYTYPVGAADAQPLASASGDGTNASNDDGNGNGNGDDPTNTYLLPDQDGKIPATQSAVTWDVVQYVAQHPSMPVPEGVCTLQIADDRGFGAARRAGYLSPNEAAVTFGFYTGEAYVPIASGGLNCPLCRPNSITKAYEAHPVAISLWVTLLICILSGMSVLFRGTAVAHAKSGSGSIRIGRNSPIEKIENDPMESEEPVRRGREVVKEGED